ncbi:MAG TPA: PQQ-binding-like beta-propeller repeat protein [Candidatus Sulfotelmatobacter sp.]|nr:PQQ-binding-like beta-propeller repeat protein [Candidatus Sulfotelmatobacter sp.]
MYLKSKMATLTIAILMIASFAITTIPAQAQIGANGGSPNNAPNGSIPLPAGVTPDTVVKSDIYLSFRPNPVGIGQPVLVNVWLDPGPSYVRHLNDYKVTFEKPDGTTEVITLNSYPADGTAWFEYVPTQIGTWKLKFEFPGGYFPAGNYTVPIGSGTDYDGYTESYNMSCYYQPDSTDWQTLTVQQDMVAAWPPAPLPTDYWTRPIQTENREWYTIAGNYPWYGPGGGPDWPAKTSTTWNARQAFVPWVQAPSTSHIAWKRLDTISAGIVGGDNGYATLSGSGSAPSIIYGGYAYSSITKPFDGTTQSVWTCTNIRTGEIKWERTNVVAPTVIEYASSATVSVPGATESGSVSVSLVAISGGRLIKYNPSTGAVTANISISPLTSGQYYMNGYALSVQDLGASKAPNRYRLINWTTFGTSSNFTTRIASNISYALDNLGQSQDFDDNVAFVIREIDAFAPGGLGPVGGFPFVNVEESLGTGIRLGYRLLGVSLKTGQLIYNKTWADEPFPADQLPYSQSCHVANNGKLAILMRKGYYNIHSATTGELLYKTETGDYPWDEPGFSAYTQASAYGLIYRLGYGGVYAYDWETGKEVWKYSAIAFSPYETPYTNENGTTVYSFNGANLVADGKIYVQNTEHTPTQPITRGWGLHCLDAKTGELLWKIIGSMRPAAVADGYLAASDSYDGHLYVFGKGKSITTVSAPDTAVSKGTALVIKGTVLDLSPAQPNTPCVSKESMTTQMQYLHKQQPIDGLWHNETIVGVPVSLTAIAADGSSIDIGTATTDGYYGTFSKAWTPPKEGDYKIIASFAGDDSYGSSGASTAISIGPAPATVEPQPQVTIPDYTMTILGVGIAVIIAVVIATILLYRKK